MFWGSKEPSHRDGSFEHPQHMFWLRNKKNNFLVGTLIWRPDRCVIPFDCMGYTKWALSRIYSITNWLSMRSVFGDILTFVDTPWYTLKFITSMVKGRFQFVIEHSSYIVVRTVHHRFCACTKFFDVCQRTVHRQRIPSLNTMRTICASAVH